MDPPDNHAGLSLRHCILQVPGVDNDLRLPFTVVPIVSVDRIDARPGDSVTVTGNGFRASEPGITVKMGQTTVAQGITAHDNGSWTDTFIVPQFPASPIPSWFQASALLPGRWPSLRWS